MKRGIRTGHGGAGIGLLVVLIAVAIGLYLMFGQTGPGGSSYMGNVKETRDRTADLGIQLQARQIAMLVAQQHSMTGRYPETLSAVEGLELGYLVDQWDQPFEMKLHREGQRVRSIELRSPGPDGQLGSEDDIVHTEPLPY